MAEGTSMYSNEDRYVSKMNLRHEKHLRKQLAILEHERSMKAKSLDADRRTFEDRIHRLNLDPSDRAHLAADTSSMVPVDKKKELDRLLKSLVHRPYETRAGYSYIEYLSRNMQPLVKRPLQWGVNPPLTVKRDGLTRNEPRKRKEAPMEQIFLTQIEGQTMSLSQRATIPHKAYTRSEGIHLPPIANKMKLVNSKIPAEKSRTSSKRELAHNKEIAEETREIVNQDETKLQKQRKKSKQKEQRISKQEESVQKSSEEAKDGKPPKGGVTMATLKVPSPTFPLIVDMPRSYEQDDEEYTKEKSEEVKIGSHSQSNYTITMYARYMDRRKSI